MNFDDRLSIALFENILVEMASFSLPEPIPFPSRGKIIHIKYLDMRWEDYRNPLISRWGQWTPFVAELPVDSGYTKNYLVWDGIKAVMSPHKVPEYYTAPNKWWEMAQGMDENGNEVIQPKVKRKVEV